MQPRRARSPGRNLPGLLCQCRPPRKVLNAQSRAQLHLHTLMRASDSHSSSQLQTEDGLLCQCRPPKKGAHVLTRTRARAQLHSHAPMRATASHASSLVHMLPGRS
mmetsp:Transcript_827/g.1851  ORF Transcript_827/g.1851 Transcript_827/m.1851 type:complete len:106 (+) Transcript_827:142-459(+)